MLEKIKKLFSVKGFERFNHIFLIGMVLIGANLLFQIIGSDYSGEITILGKDNEGQFRVLSVAGKKSAPPMNLNMLGVHVHTNLDKEVSYHRRIGDLWGFNFYAGGGIIQGMNGRTGYKIGIIIGF